MKVSIITPCYNSERTLKDTIESILNQSYSNIEYVLVNDGSSDNTLDIINQYISIGEKKISKMTVVDKANEGNYSFAMNRGISTVTGDIIGILNSDDFYIDKDIIRKVVEVFEKNKDVDALYSNLYYVDKFDTSKIIRKWKSKQYTRKDFLLGWMPPHPTLFVRKKVYDRLGVFNTQFRIAADYELILRFLFKNNVKAKHMDFFSVKMRVGGVSSKNVKNRILANKEDKLAWKINNLTPFFFTMWLKPLRKLSQFF